MKKKFFSFINFFINTQKSSLFFMIFVLSFVPLNLKAEDEFIAPSNFKVSEKAVEVLKILEGYRGYVYYDNNMNLIFGYGHLVQDYEEEFLKSNFGFETVLESGERKLNPPSKTLSEEKKKNYVETLFQKDIENVVNFMKENITVPLKQHQIDAIIIYLFWRGPNPLNPDVLDFYNLINQRKEKELLKFMLYKPKSDKNYLPGLQRRNRQTVELYTTGYYLFD